MSAANAGLANTAKAAMASRSDFIGGNPLYAERADKDTLPPNGRGPCYRYDTTSAIPATASILWWYFLSLLCFERNSERANYPAQSGASIEKRPAAEANARLRVCSKNTTRERDPDPPRGPPQNDRRAKKTPRARARALSRPGGISRIAQRPHLNRHTSWERIVCTYLAL